VLVLLLAAAGLLLVFARHGCGPRAAVAPPEPAGTTGRAVVRWRAGARGSTPQFGEVRGEVRGPAGPVAGASVCAFGDSLADAPICTGAIVAGNFHLMLPPGAHRLAASAEGYTRPLLPAAAPPVRVEPGAVVEGVVLRLVPAPARIEGTIADALGGAVEGATVAALARGTVWAGTQEKTPWAVAQTDEDGAFALGVVPGPVTLAVWAAGYVPSRRHVFAPAQDVDVALVPGAEIHGRVFGPQGAALAGADVTVRRVDRYGADRRVRAGAAGDYHADGLVPGTYEVTASAPGACGLADRHPTLALGQSERVDLHLRACADLDATVRGGRPPRPCAEGHVELLGPSAAVVTVPVRAGRAQARGIEPGSYRVQARCGAQGRTVDLGQLRMEPGSPARPTWDLPDEDAGDGELVVEVRNDRGDPEAYAEVVARGPGAQERRAHSGPTGTARFEAVPAGRVRVWATSSGGARAESVLATVRSGDRTEVRLRLAAVGAVTGRVEDPSGVPVQAGVQVLDEAGGVIAGAVSSQAGAFEIEQVAPGTWRLAVPGFRVIAPEVVEIAARETANVVVRVRPAACVLTVRVHDPAGAPVVDAFVIARDEQTGVWTEAVTGADGVARLEGLAEGIEVRVWARGPSGDATDPWQATCPEVTEVELPGTARVSGVLAGLDPAHPVILEAQDPGGSWQIRMNLPPGTTAWRLAPVLAGRPIELAARAGRAHAGRRLAPLRPGEARAGIVLALRSMVRAHGVLEHRAGEPVAGAWILPMFGGVGAGDAVAAGTGNRTDEAGRFHLDAVPTGPLDLLIQGVPGAPRLLRVTVPEGPDPVDLGVLRLE